MPFFQTDEEGCSFFRIALCREELRRVLGRLPAGIAKKLTTTGCERAVAGIDRILESTTNDALTDSFIEKLSSRLPSGYRVERVPAINVGMHPYLCRIVRENGLPGPGFERRIFELIQKACLEVFFECLTEGEDRLTLRDDDLRAEARRQSPDLQALARTIAVAYADFGAGYAVFVQSYNSGFEMFRYLMYLDRMVEADRKLPEILADGEARTLGSDLLYAFQVLKMIDQPIDLRVLLKETAGSLAAAARALGFADTHATDIEAIIGLTRAVDRLEINLRMALCWIRHPEEAASMARLIRRFELKPPENIFWNVRCSKPQHLSRYCGKFSAAFACGLFPLGKGRMRVPLAASRALAKGSVFSQALCA